MLRLFVAWAPAPASRATLAAEGERLAAAAPALRVVRPEDLHVTLAFLGATPDDAVPPLRTSLGAVAATCAPFAVTFEGLGAFPTFRRPRVLWAGIGPPAGERALVALAKRAVRGCAEAGTPADTRGSFHPHLTLGRLDGGPPPPALEILLTRGDLQSTYMAEMLSDLLLMVSDADGGGPGVPGPRRPGSRYRVLATFPLGGGATTCPGRGSEAGGDGSSETGGRGPTT